MSDHNGLEYLFDQLNLDARKAIWYSTINEFDFEIRYIKGKERGVADSLRIIVYINQIVAMSSYGTDLQERSCMQGNIMRGISS